MMEGGRTTFCNYSGLVIFIIIIIIIIGNCIVDGE